MEAIFTDFIAQCRDDLYNWTLKAEQKLVEVDKMSSHQAEVLLRGVWEVGR